MRAAVPLPVVARTYEAALVRPARGSTVLIALLVLTLSLAMVAGTVLGEGEEDADPVHEPLPNCADVPAAHRPTGPPPLRGACNHLVRAFFGGSCEGKVHLRRRKGWRFRRVRGGICTCTLRCSRPARWSWSVPAPTPTAFSSGLANNGCLGADVHLHQRFGGQSRRVH